MNLPRARRPRCIVIAGPNGAGKTTFAREYLPREAGVIHFVNADLIAEGLSPLRPELATLTAGRLALAEQGGHNVERADVLRRFERGWANFEMVYRPVADGWAVYDNSRPVPRLLEKGP